MANKSNNSSNRRPNVPVHTMCKNKGFYPQNNKQSFGKKWRREDGKIKY